MRLAILLSLAKRRVPILGEQGVSLSFSIGMVKFSTDLTVAREMVRECQAQVTTNRYLSVIASVKKKMSGKGFFFHATDDPPEVRAIFFELLDKLDFACEVMVARKNFKLFAIKHHNRDTEFYADVLSQLLKDEVLLHEKLVLNIAERGHSTKHSNLQFALEKAIERHKMPGGADIVAPQVVFNVQNQHNEPLLNVADYICWAVQRVFERGETRYYDYLGEKIRVVSDLYGTNNSSTNESYYGGGNRLTSENRLSPPSP